MRGCDRRDCRTYQPRLPVLLLEPLDTLPVHLALKRRVDRDSRHPVELERVHVALPRKEENLDGSFKPQRGADAPTPLVALLLRERGHIDFVVRYLLVEWQEPVLVGDDVD